MAIDNTQSGQSGQANQKGQQPQQSQRSDKQANRSDRSGSDRSDRNFDQDQPDRETPDVQADQSKAWDQKQKDTSSQRGSSSSSDRH